MSPMFRVLSWGRKHRGESPGLDRASSRAHSWKWDMAKAGGKAVVSRGQFLMVQMGRCGIEVT